MKRYILKFKGLFSLTCLFEVLLSGFSIASAFMLQWLIDLATGGNLNKFLRGVIFFIIFCIVGFLVDALGRSVRTVYVNKTVVHIKENIFTSLMKKDMKSFNKDNSAKYISILSNDIDMIENDGIATILNLVSSFSGFILALVSVIYLSIPVTIAIFAMGTVTFFLPQLFSKGISKRRDALSTSLENLTIKTKDILSGFEVIRNFNISHKINKIYSTSVRTTGKKKTSFSIYSGVVEAFSQNLGMLMFSAPIAIGGYFVIKGDLTIGKMIALIQLLNNVINPLTSASNRINKIKSLKPIIEKIDILTTEDVKEEAKYSLDSFNKTIELKDIYFSYDGAKKALKNINQTFEKGKKYALVGGSGSGKSTILRLLLRYYEEFDGSILIDGKEHRDIDINHIYKHLSVIQQNVFMFDGTVKDNIGLYGEYSDEEILKAAKMAGLSKLIESLPKGIYEDVGENGSRLSGGEKQRVAIARALMKNSSIMLLDESTSALDNETAFSIEKSLLELEGVTSIVITHKLMEEILKKYDEIIVMRDGTIVERGEFNELISEKGYFYSLYNVGQTLEDEASENSLAV